jgi:hypothetical protein
MTAGLVQLGVYASSLPCCLRLSLLFHSEAEESGNKVTWVRRDAVTLTVLENLETGPIEYVYLWLTRDIFCKRFEKESGILTSG